MHVKHFFLYNDYKYYIKFITEGMWGCGNGKVLLNNFYTSDLHKIICWYYQGNSLLLDTMEIKWLVFMG